MKRAFTLIGLVGVLLGCSQSPDYLSNVRAFEEHKNRGDLESALALFAEAPIMNFGVLGSLEGMAELRGILEYDVALNTHLQFDGCEVTGREVSCRVIETNDWLKTAGIDFIAYDENKFTFSSDNRIEAIAATLSEDSAQRLGAAMTEFHEWGTTHHPMQYGALFSEDGKFIYSGQNAAKVMALLKLWRNN
ncbi:MAG: hypothetical protein AAF438_08770 [Pseudomonadota bacterium]